MNAKVTPPAAGSHLPRDSRSSYFDLQRQRRPSPEPEASPTDESLRIGALSRRYGSEESAATASVGHAISYSQTQAGFLQMAHKALDRMTELSVLCQDTTKSDPDRASYTSEFTQLQNFISDIGTKRFNGSSLFSGSTLDLSLDQRQVPIDAIDLNAAAPQGGLAEVYDLAGTEISTNPGAAAALATIQKAINNLTEMQGKVSANLQRLNLSSEQLSLLQENLSAATGRVSSLDLAKIFSELAQDTILRRSDTAILAQANTIPEAAIRLLE